MSIILRHRLRPPMTMEHVHARHSWIIPTAGAVFCTLAVLAAFDLLPWDPPITQAAVDARTPANVLFFRRISFLGSTKVVLAVAGLAAVAALPRSPRLAGAIVAIALARPLVEWSLKELVDRPRPPIEDRLLPGRGPSFPAGHPLATAASWCLIPLVVELYVKRKEIWWATVVIVWTLAVVVGASRIWLGVHWFSDVVAALTLAILGVAAAEHAMDASSARPAFPRRRRGPD